MLLLLTGCSLFKDLGDAESDCHGDTGDDWVEFTCVDEAGAIAPPMGEVMLVDAAGTVDCSDSDGSGDSPFWDMSMGTYRCLGAQPGPIRIEVELIGFEPLVLETDHPDTEACNDKTELGAIALTAADCDDVEVPALRLEVVEAGQPAAGLMLTAYAQDESSLPCEETAVGTYACAPQKAGEVLIKVEETDYREGWYVEHDGCHPVTVDDVWDLSAE